MLAEKIPTELLRAAQHGEGTALRELTAAITSDNVLLDDAGNLRFIDPLIRLKRPALEIINTLTEATS